jgi:exonuclease III
MIYTFWNIMGLNKLDRTKVVSDFIKTNRLDFVGFQETKKIYFTANTLQLFYKHMSWHFMPAKGSAGAILVGFKTPTFDVLS